MTLEAYVFRVILFLLAFASLGVTLYWGVRVVETIHSAGSRSGDRNEKAA